MLHEHAAALSATSPANRSRRLIKCAKDLHATERCAIGPDTSCKEPKTEKSFRIATADPCALATFA